ncbi:AraC family transcriptional regulator [Nonomuraea purpurea]|uniref:AraC family transcriptional regulator n=1 Tax=Nonomuraea purpurea TaxID=1849276 RepID=A0ABV8GMS9_9ACTN
MGAGRRMWRADDLGGLEVFHATLDAFSFRPHAHEEYFIALTEHGLVTPTYRGRRHVVGPGELIVLNPEEAHAGGPPEGMAWTYRALYPGPELIDAVMAGFPRPATPRFGGDVVRDRQVASRLRRFHTLSARAGTSALERESCLAEALVLLVSRHAPPPRDPWPAGRERAAVRLAREFLDEHAPANVTLRELAAHAGLSAYHLCRVFGRAVGMTPHAYQRQARVRLAKALLRAGLAPARVAAEAGFYDQAHLTRHFKHVVGITPGQYLSAVGELRRPPAPGR